jgi:hypothetical protein
MLTDVADSGAAEDQDSSRHLGDTPAKTCQRTQLCVASKWRSMFPEWRADNLGESGDHTRGTSRGTQTAP